MAVNTAAPQLAPVPAVMPPGARKVSGTLTERSVNSELRRLADSAVMAEYTAARHAWAVAEGERQGAWFAYDQAARPGSPAPWRVLWAYYRAALRAEQAASGRLRAAVDALTLGC